MGHNIRVFRRWALACCSSHSGFTPSPIPTVGIISFYLGLALHSHGLVTVGIEPKSHIICTAPRSSSPAIAVTMAPTKRRAHPWKTQPRDAFRRFARGAATSPTSKVPGDCRNAGEVGAGVLSGRRSEPTAASGPSARPQRALQIPRRYAPTSTPSRSGDRPSNHGAGAELGGSGPTGTRRTSSTIGPPRASASALRIANAEPGTSRQPSRRGRFRRSSTVPISPSPGAYVTTKLSYINKGDGSGHKVSGSVVHAFLFKENVRMDKILGGTVNNCNNSTQLIYFGTLMCLFVVITESYVL